MKGTGFVGSKGTQTLEDFYRGIGMRREERVADVAGNHKEHIVSNAYQQRPESHELELAVVSSRGRNRGRDSVRWSVPGLDWRH
jgi:hypothetical protein